MRRALAIVLVAAFPAAAAAEPEPAAPTEDIPAPGTCRYVRRQKGVKVCATLDGVGSFDIITYPPNAVRITFADQITSFTPPHELYFEAEISRNEQAITISPIRTDLPARTTSTVTAGTVTVTINLVPARSASSVDAQVQIVDPGQAARDAEIDRHVEERMRPLAEALDLKERALDERVVTTARDRILDDLATDAEVREPGGTTIDRNAKLIVLRAERVVHLGTTSYLVFSVENLSADPFEVAAVHVWTATKGKASAAASPAWHLRDRTIAPAARVRGALVLPARHQGRAQSIGIRVEERDPDRSVELRGIQVK